jgi:hypothetical protein
MKYITEHPILRMLLILLFFLSGIILVITGWKKTGELEGLIQMVVGVGGLLLALAVYNYPYRCRK